MFCALEELQVSSNIVSLYVCVGTVNNNMLNIKINTSRVKVIAFFSSSTSIDHDEHDAAAADDDHHHQYHC